MLLSIVEGSCIQLYYRNAAGLPRATELNPDHLTVRYSATTMQKAILGTLS
jgi:hypothetical protein